MKINTEKMRLAVRILLILAMVITVAFIFSNSMKSKTESSKDSGIVSDIIAEIIPPDTSLGATIQKNIRKIAHFTEFGALGIEVALYIWIFCGKKIKSASFSVLFALVVGFCDETIQIFFDRGASISDVWIDVGGFCFFSLISHGVCFCAMWIYRRVKNMEKDTEPSARTAEEDNNG